MLAPAAANEKISDMFVIDIRGTEDFEKGHIAGSYNVVFTGGELAGLLDRLPLDKEILVVCASGQTANQVNGALNTAGFNSKALTGGLNNWKKAELPVEGTGVNPLSALPAVSAPATDVDKLAWQNAEGFLGAIVSAETNNMIAPAKLAEELTANAGKYHVMDIRAPKADNFDLGHIEGSEFYSWDDLDKKIEQLPKDKTLIVGCWSGNNAGQAVAILRIAGYDVKSLQGGIDNGWLEKAKPEADRKPFPVVK
jgi:rhodanese-related sulfurtransferase